MDILLDTNAYLRLAKQFHPLLGDNFLIPPNFLRVLSEVDRELSASQRLETKFFWAAEKEYSENRSQNTVVLVGRQATDVFNAKSVVQGVSKGFRDSGEYKRQRLTAPSPTDCLVLAYAYVLGITIIADDGGMNFLAKELGITLLGSHQLLKIMLEAGKVTLENIQTAARYLNYINDMPASWAKDSQSLFGTTLP